MANQWFPLRRKKVSTVPTSDFLVPMSSNERLFDTNLISRASGTLKESSTTSGVLLAARSGCFLKQGPKTLLIEFVTYMLLSPQDVATVCSSMNLSLLTYSVWGNFWTSRGTEFSSVGILEGKIREI